MKPLPPISRLLLVTLAGAAGAAGPLAGQDTAPESPVEASADSARVNPFAGIETIYLSNGVKLWFKRRPGIPNVSVSVGVPYGSDLDPHGKEQLAHFTEHMLFSDHDGRSEEEIKDAVEGLGGRRNGITYGDRTYYYVTIGQEHGYFAIEWLSGLMEPHAMEPEVVERGRQPVAVEVNARPLEFFEQVFLALNPEFLRPPGFWEREFGMQTRRQIYDTWKTLHSITPEDLRGFYDRYYAPGAMTLTVVGDLERDSVVALAERTFGTLPEREVAPQAYDAEDPRRARATFSWDPFRSDIGYQRRFKLFNHTAEDELNLLFIRDVLGRRLNQRLRYGEQKAVYGISVALVKRGPSAYLQIRGQINEDEYDYALQVLDEELEMLRNAGLDSEAFEADRRAVIERVRTTNLTAESLNFWSRNYFHNPNVFTDFPDVLDFYEGVTQQELASFVNRSLLSERELLSVAYMQPVSQGVLLLTVILLIIGTHRGVSWTLTRPIEMRKLRYMARVRTPLLIRIVRTIVFGGLGLVLARLVIAFLIWAGGSWVATVDSYLVQMASYALMLSGSMALVILYMARFPRKVLVFPDHIRIKSRTYASRALRPEDVEEISLRRFKDVWLSADLLRTTALAFGFVKPGIFVRPKKGRALFFRARDTEELAEVLGEWRGEPVAGAKAAGPADAAEVAPPAPVDTAVGDGGASGPTRPNATGDAPREATADDEEPTEAAGVGVVAVTDAVTDAEVDSVGLTEEEKRELLGEG